MSLAAAKGVSVNAAVEGYNFNNFNLLNEEY